ATISRVFTGLFTAKRCLGHCTIHRLPAPIQTDQIGVYFDSQVPQFVKNARLGPLLVVSMGGASRSKFWWNSFPLASCSQAIENRIGNPPRIRPRASAFTTWSIIGQEVLHLLPEFIGHSIFVKTP